MEDKTFLASAQANLLYNLEAITTNGFNLLTFGLNYIITNYTEVSQANQVRIIHS